MEETFTLLLEQLEQEEQLFKQMLALSREQAAFFKEHEPDEESLNQFSGFLDQRQQLMDEIDILSASIRHLEEKLWPAATGSQLKSLTSQHETYVGRKQAIRALIVDIQNHDDKCRQAALKILDQMGTKLSSARENKKAYQAYTQSNAYQEAWFFDKKK